MNEQFSDLTTKLSPALSFIKRYLTFSVIILFLASYAFLVYRINTLASREPTDDEITSALKALPLPKVDQPTINKIQQLQDQNVQVQSLFEQARNNPFSE